MEKRNINQLVVGGEEEGRELSDSLREKKGGGRKLVFCLCARSRWVEEKRKSSHAIEWPLNGTE